MATLRKCLESAGFDWEHGEILYQAVDKDDYPGWTEPRHGELIDATHPVLDKKFDDGFGGPHMPRFVARDAFRVYFPAMYDGSTWIDSVELDWKKYLGDNPEPTPYVGGN